MTPHIAEHAHYALELGSCLLLAVTLVLIRGRRRRRERDQKNRAKAQETLLKQKDLLIREVYHRVANQMGLTAALLHLQASRSSHPEAKASLMDSETRIRTLAKLHTRLQKTHHHSRVPLCPYLSDLARDLITTLRPDLVYCSELSEGTLSAGSGTAITCGLLVHELIANSIKHAFPLNRPGTVRLSLHRPPPDRLRISIHDDGAGLPHEFTLQRNSSSGMMIISALAKDLGGTFEVFRRDPGTECVVEFPLTEYEEAL
ncbi:MAG: sensor histidine kinase [bacterium]